MDNNKRANTVKKMRMVYVCVERVHMTSQHMTRKHSPSDSTLDDVRVGDREETTRDGVGPDNNGREPNSEGHADSPNVRTNDLISKRKKETRYIIMIVFRARNMYTRSRTSFTAPVHHHDLATLLAWLFSILLSIWLLPGRK